MAYATVVGIVVNTGGARVPFHARCRPVLPPTGVSRTFGSRRARSRSVTRVRICWFVNDARMRSRKRHAGPQRNSCRLQRRFPRLVIPRKSRSFLLPGFAVLVFSGRIRARRRGLCGRVCTRSHRRVAVSVSMCWASWSCRVRGWLNVRIRRPGEDAKYLWPPRNRVEFSLMVRVSVDQATRRSPRP